MKAAVMLIFWGEITRSGPDYSGNNTETRHWPSGWRKPHFTGSPFPFTGSGETYIPSYSTSPSENSIIVTGSWTLNLLALGQV
jgi:hypothetical protein